MPVRHLSLSRLLNANAQWAEDVERSHPGFFQELAKGQTPHTLWIGCADSRVPDSVITGVKPGEIFVHRNIANQLHEDDESALSVLTYAVDFLGVEHVIVVGHTGCGGAAACLSAARSPTFSPEGRIITIPTLKPSAPLNRWLAPLSQYATTINLPESEEDALAVLVDENVKRQVDNLCKTSTITNAWANKSLKGKDVWVHGWVYDLARGKLRDLEVSRGPDIPTQNDPRGSEA
ncbi:carbonic anhydrase [Infundibulicybe gibba]|nr:carbonic anhydrase [Infundibulicybe gibba]